MKYLKPALKFIFTHGLYITAIVMFILWKIGHMDVGKNEPLFDAVWDNANGFIHDVFMHSKQSREEIKKMKEDFKK